jgi:branched-chain amino acid transport system substrate-binding protein
MQANLLRKLSFVLLVVLLVAVIAPFATAQEEGDTVTIAPGENIMIGLATILSGEGLVPLGDDITRGVEIALAARDNVLTIGETEFPVMLDIQDDQCSAEGGQAVANYFVSQPAIVGVVGPTCSSACRAAGPIFDEAGFSMISSSCTAPDLTAEGTGFASFNRIPPNDSVQGPAVAEFIYNDLGFTTIATVHDSSPYGEGLVSAITERFEELGGTVAYEDAINVGDTDFRNLLDSVAAADVELLFFGGFPAEGSRIAQQRADVGLEDLPLMSGDGNYNPEFITLAGDDAEGVYVSSPAPLASEPYDEFVALYEETYGTAPTGPYHAYAYDAANILLDAIEATGTVDDSGNLVLSRSAISEFVRAFGADESFTGLSGVLSCSGTGECALGGIGVFQVAEGAFSRLETSAEAMSGEMMATEEADMMATEEAAATEEAGS